MAKLFALLAALGITALGGLLALYAARLSMLIFVHWEGWVAISLLFYASVFLAARQSKRRAQRQAAKEEPLPAAARRP